METRDLDQLLTSLTPDELRARIADLDRQRAALAVLLRAACARRPRRHPAPARQEEGCHAS